jgi:hypothetical protein
LDNHFAAVKQALKNHNKGELRPSNLWKICMLKFRTIKNC